MKRYRHPSLKNVSLLEIMQALSDPCRVKIVRQLLETEDMELTCGDFDMGVCKATRSHHFQVLREAGLVKMRSDGTKCVTSLRSAEVEKKFPGLLALVASSPAKDR